MITLKGAKACRAGIKSASLTRQNPYWRCHHSTTGKYWLRDHLAVRMTLVMITIALWFGAPPLTKCLTRAGLRRQRRLIVTGFCTC